MFSKTFRSKVQPVELARKLAKEMDAHKTVSISRTYVPNEYTVYLSPQDMSEVESYKSALAAELSSHLLEHARSEGLSLLTKPAITFEDDDRLRLGEFGIQTRLVKPPTEDDIDAGQGGLGHTMVYTSLHEPPPEEPEPARPGQKAPPRRPYLVVGGKRYSVDGPTVIVGRSKSCDIVLKDANVSRRHAEITSEGDHWYLTDLDSMNGVKINSRRVQSSRLSPGDELEMGTSRLEFELE